MDLASYIADLGFPVAMVIYFIWDKNNSNKTMIQAINNQTKVLNKILVKLGCYDLSESEVDVNE